MIILICNDHLDLQVYSSATLLELDDIYTRRLAGFTNLPGFNTDNHGCHHCYIVININIIIFNCLVAGFTNLPGLNKIVMVVIITISIVVIIADIKIVMFVNVDTMITLLS